MISTSWGFILSTNSDIIQTNFICLMTYHGVCLIRFYAETLKTFPQESTYAKVVKNTRFFIAIVREIKLKRN